MSSEHFVKVYGTILDSSIWSESKATRILWFTMLAMADSTGFVEASTPGLGRRANITATECRAAVKILEAPDLESKSQEYGGRRIEKIDRGWQLLNYQHYREMRTEAQIKRAERQARWREKKRKNAASTVGDVDVPERLHNAQRGEGRGERGEGREISTSEVVDEKKPGQSPAAPPPPTTPPQTPDAYYRACTISLNQAMAENTTIEGEWMPLTASSQIGNVTWMEDGIPLAVAEEVIRERSLGYKSTPQHRGPRTLKYFDAAVREQWERGKMSKAEHRVTEAFQ